MVLTYAYNALSATTSTNYQFAHHSAGNVNVWLYPVLYSKLRLLSSTDMKRHHKVVLLLLCLPIGTRKYGGRRGHTKFGQNGPPSFLCYSKAATKDCHRDS